MKLPEKFMGKPVEGAMERLLKKEEKKQEPVPANADLKGFIYVPSIGLYIGKERVHQGKSWAGAHRELAKEGCSMPTIYQFKEFLKFLKRDYQDKRQAEKILDDILAYREPWRGEWLDAHFTMKGKKFDIEYEHRADANGNLVPQKVEKPEVHLTDYKTPGIDIDDWLDNANSQGLPKRDVKDGSLYYRSPTGGRVAGFNAGSSSSTATLSCVEILNIADDSVGVRRVLKIEGERK